MNTCVALSEEEKNRIELDNIKAVGLPNRCYIDEQFLSHEYEQLFKPGWVAVGVGSEIPDKGDAKPVLVAGVPLIIIRDSECRILAFHNVCSHRGTKLLDEPCSSKRTLICPYHAWSYGLDGRLIATPNFGGEAEHKPDGFDGESYGLKRVRTSQWLDVIFVNLSGMAEPLEQVIEPLKKRWQDYDFSGLCHGGAEDGIVIQELQTNWKIVAENFLDTYHLPVVHGSSLQAYSPLDERYCFHEPNRFIGVGSRVYMPERGEPLPQFPDLSESQAKVAEYCYVFPNLSLGLSRDHLMVIIDEPVSNHSTKLSVHIYYASGQALDDCYTVSRNTTNRDFKQVLEEDREIVNRLQTGRESPSFDGGCFSPKVDVTIRQLHGFFAKHL